MRKEKIKDKGEGSELQDSVHPWEIRGITRRSPVRKGKSQSLPHT